MSFIPGVTAIRAALASAPPQALNLALGEPQFPPPASVFDLLRKQAAAWPFGYTPIAGIPLLRQAIARQAGESVAPDQVCVTCGAQEALYIAAHLLLDRGDEALVPDPGFMVYTNLTRMRGAIPVPYAAPRHGEEPYDLREIERLLTPRTRVLFLNSPANPTGAVAGAAFLEALAALCAGSEVTIVADEVYRVLYYSTTPPASLAAHTDRHFVISSLSKSHCMPGLRLGWAIGPREKMAAFSALHQHLTTCAPALSQQIALHLLQHPDTGYVGKLRRRLKQRRDLLIAILSENPNWRITRPQAGLFLFAQYSPDSAFPEPAPAQQLLQATGVVLVPGDAFGRRGAGYLRLSFAPKESVLEKAARRLASFQ